MTVCIHFGLIMALRSLNVGTDTEVYSNLFSKISNGANVFTVIDSAPIYVIYNKLLSFIFHDPQWIIVFNSVLIISGIGLFIYRSSPNAIMSFYFYIALYFYFQSFNISRQFLAVVLIANSYYYLKNNMIKKFLIIIVIATLIHNTAIVSLILWPLKKVKWSHFKIYILAMVLTILLLLYDKLLNIFLFVFPRYSMYMGGGLHSLTDEGQGRKIIVTIFYLLIIVVTMFFLNFKKNINVLAKDNLYFLTAIMTIAVVLGILFYNNLLMSRIEIYFSLFIIIYIPVLLEHFTKSKLVLYYCLMIITAIPMLVQLNGNISGVIPYHFYWAN